MPVPFQKKRSRWRLVLLAHLYALWITLILLLGSGFLIWKSQTVRSWAHSALLRLYVSKVAPKLPFTIENLSVDATWEDFLKGRMKNVDASLLWDEWLLHFSGPIEITRKEGHFFLQSHPLVTITPPITLKSSVPALPELPIELSLSGSETLRHFTSLAISTQVESFAWKALHLNLQELALDLKWDGNRATLLSSAKSLKWSDPENDRTLVIQEPHFSIQDKMQLKPFHTDPTVQLELKAQSAESQWEKKKWIFPLKNFPILGSETTSNENHSFELSMGKSASPEISLTGTIQKQNETQTQLSLQWKTLPVSLPAFLDSLFSIGKLGNLRYLKNFSGKIQTKGSASFALPLRADTLQTAKVDAEVDLKHVSFEWNWKFLAVSDLNLSLPISSEKGVQALLSIDKILYRRFQAKLGPTQIRLTPTTPSRKKFELEIAGPSLNLPLTIQNRELKIGNIIGTVSLPEKAKLLDYDLDTSVQLKPTETTTLLNDACLSLKHIPPSQLSVNFSDLNFRTGAIDPTGNIHVDLFKGSINLDEIGIFDLETEAPEVDFNLDVNGIRLADLGDWSGFGEMDGILHAYAHDVVIEGWLPTQYDFLFEAKHLNHPKIVFSSEAMKNLGKLVAADAIQNLPGIADWLTFGWPSRIFLGGFDIWFAGISLFSHHGSIMMETPVPDGLPPEIAAEQKQNHYILYGNRFKIPLRAPHYPVLVDVTAMSSYLGRVAKKLGDIREKKNAKEKKHEKPQLDCPSPHL